MLYDERLVLKNHSPLNIMQKADCINEAKINNEQIKKKMSKNNVFFYDDIVNEIYLKQ